MPPEFINEINGLEQETVPDLSVFADTPRQENQKTHANQGVPLSVNPDTLAYRPERRIHRLTDQAAMAENAQSIPPHPHAA